MKEIKIEYIFFIFLAFSLSIFVKSLRQYFFLKQISIKISFKENIIIYLAGLSMIISPGGMGEIIKSHFLRENHNISISKTSPIVLIERYHDALAIFSILVVFQLIKNIEILTIPIYLVGIVLISCLILVKNRKILDKITSKLTKIRFLKKFKNNSKEFNETVFSLSSKKSIFYGWTLSLVAWFFDAVGIFLCFVAFGIEFDFILSTIIGFSSIFFGAISFLPAGIGVTEISFVHLLLPYGIELSVATALVIFIRLCSIWYATLIGIIAVKFAFKKFN
jgi:uncharacterized protein (TIRG00374 family)|tara:strand:+ start:1584 stop:2417 length:834 start_codon:yes stop_codon:yes gene_type:complete